MMVNFNGSHERLRQLIQQLPQILAGEMPDTYGLAVGLQLRCGVALLSQIQQDFITKSRGGVGRDGIQWPALKRETIAQRRTTVAERKAAGVSGKRVRGLLTAAQDKRWRAVYASTLAGLRAYAIGEGAARAKAAAIAWATVKREGAKTKLDVFGARKVDILRDTGELLRSLSPGVEDRPSRAPGQVFDVTQPGRVIVGTNKKTWHHTGTSTLPARPLWPLNNEIPAAWWPAIEAAALRGVQLILQEMIRRGRS